MKRWDSVHSAQLPPSWNNIVRFLAVKQTCKKIVRFFVQTLELFVHLYPPVWVSVLHHDNQPSPPLGKIVGGHTLSTFMSLAPNENIQNKTFKDIKIQIKFCLYMSRWSQTQLSY